jgi:hypothetical protein
MLEVATFCDFPCTVYLLRSGDYKLFDFYLDHETIIIDIVSWYSHDILYIWTAELHIDDIYPISERVAMQILRVKASLGACADDIEPPKRTKGRSCKHVASELQ